MTRLACLLWALAAGAWEEAARRDGVTVFTRDRAGSSFREIRAVGIIDAPPTAVWKVLTDFARYREVLPYFEESRIVGVEEGGRVVHVYVVFDPPVIDRRDFTERIVDESDWREGHGYFKLRWTASERGPAPREGMVRVTRIEGSWLLEPVDGGLRTRATHELFTDPGGRVPAFLANLANTRALPDTFASLARHAGAH